MDFVEVNEHIAEWCDENGYSIVESHKLKNRQIEIVDIRYGLLLRICTDNEIDLDLLQEVLNGIGSAKINNLYDNCYCVFFKTRNKKNGLENQVRFLSNGFLNLDLRSEHGAFCVLSDDKFLGHKFVDCGDGEGAHKRCEAAAQFVRNIREEVRSERYFPDKHCCDDGNPVVRKLGKCGERCV